MKKKFVSIIMLFAVTFCFVTGCKKDNDNKEQEILKDKNGKEIIATINGNNYTANDVYDEMLTNSASVEYMYEKLEDLLISTIVPVTSTMRNTVTNEVEVWKKEIKENASISGISYKDALKAGLKEEGVSSEKELIEKKIFAWQEEILTSKYWRDNEDNYLRKYFENRYVYHISQIVVNVSSNENYDYFNVEPDKNVFKKLYDVVNSLATGIPFYQVAVEYSDDASYSNGGDLGMVTLNDTSLVEEVKFALASYSKYVEGMNIENVPEYLDVVYKDGIEAIPQSYVDKLMEKDAYGDYFYEDETTKYINSLPSSFDNSRVYGRNVIFNNLFNSRTFRVIESETSSKAESVDYVRMPKEDVVGFDVKGTRNVLVNDEGNPILVVKSSKGIHFISIKKSPSVGVEELLKYYSTEIDEADEITTYVEKSIDPSVQEQRISEIKALAKEYAILAVGDNSTFVGNEDFIRYDMFLDYLGESNQGVKFELSDTIEEMIIGYIENQKTRVENQINNEFLEKYEIYANKAEHADNPLIVKEIPILKCLKEKACTYTYSEGFKVYTGGGQ